MKKWIKLSSVLLLSLFLVACDKLPGKDKAKVENAPTEETTTTMADTDQASSKAENTQTTVAQTSTEESMNDAKGEEGKATVLIHQENGDLLEFEVTNVGGVSVLEAMSAIEDLDFNFNENEGVVDQINGIENDYAPNTWMYLINKQFAELGVVSQKLEDGDEIEWYFGTIDDIPVTIIPAGEETANPAE